MSVSAEVGLPVGWGVSTLGDVCDYPQYGWTTSARETGSVRLLRTTDISKGKLDWTSVPFCAENPPELDHYRLNAGDIVISRAGSVGVSALIQECPEAVFASYLIRFRPKVDVDARYVSHFLQSPRYWRAVLISAAGIALQNVNARKFAAISLPVAPLREQWRIVAEIEKEFTRLEAAVEALKRARTNLKRYRASVLKAACEGRLGPTEAKLARAEGRDYEPADKLLARILKERRARWEANQLAKMHAACKPPNDDKWKAKYKEPAAPDTSNMPELPEGWVWASLEQLSWTGSYGTSEKCDYGFPGPPVLRIPNIERGRVDLKDLKFASAQSTLDKPDALLPGDFLVIRTNGSRDLIGRGALVQQAFDRSHFYASYLIRFRVSDGLKTGRWIGTIWDCDAIRTWIEREAATSAGQYNISLSKLNRLLLPLPAEREQSRIVAEVERRLSVIDELEAVVESNLKRAARLRQAILKRAFEGKLVPQDPNDEPASVLLERIRAERAAKQVADWPGLKRVSRERKTAASGAGRLFQ